MIANFENMIKALDLIILVIILAAGSLALVVLINLTQVNVAERTREIATLKVLGFRPKEVDSYIFKEIFMYFPRRGSREEVTPSIIGCEHRNTVGTIGSGEEIFSFIIINNTSQVREHPVVGGVSA